MHGQPKNLTSSASDQVTRPETAALPRRDAAGPDTRALPDAFDPKSPRDPHWFKTAVFYEVSVRGFADSNG
ncbi:hypothetical protein, partial [Actinomadura livida]